MMMMKKSKRTDLDLQLFIQSIVDPQVDVSFPVSLLLDGGHVGDGSLINLSYCVWVGIILHQTKVIKPGVVVVWVCLIGTNNDSEEDRK